MNPSAPTIKGLIKIHKPNHPNRPVVNWRRAPAYKLSRHLTDTLNRIAPLPNALNISNSLDLLNKLKHIPMLPQYSLASLDIASLYTNIPTQETRTILAGILQHQQVDDGTTSEHLNCYDTVTSQNCFSHLGKIIIQKDGLAMGAPSSSLIAEMFLQHVEHTYLAHLSTRLKIVYYCRYVDDILIIFDTRHASLPYILGEFKNLHPKLQFSAEGEVDGKLNFLDVTIDRLEYGLKFAIHKKPTATDSIIPYDSNHPPAHN
jgi:hypothetical protein